MNYPRFAPFDIATLDGDRRRIAEEIIGGRKSLDGPFSAMLRSPEIADSFQKIGAYLRFRSPLPIRLRELAIITVARYWSSEYEWYAHKRFALDAGLEPETIDAIEDGARPQLAGDDAAVFNFAASLLTTGFATDALFTDVTSRFGEAGASELVAIVGYYCAVSFYLNTDMFPLPQGVQPLKKLKLRAFSG